MINPLTTFLLSSAFDKSQLPQSNVSGMLIFESWLQSEKQECYLCAMQPLWLYVCTSDGIEPVTFHFPADF